MSRPTHVLEALVSQAPNLAVQAYDAQGRVTLWNAASQRLFGYPADAVLGKKLGGLILTPADAESFGRVVERVLRTGVPEPLQEWDAFTATGEPRHIISSAFPLGEGDEARVICMDLDATESHRARQALHETHELLDLVMQSTTDAITVRALDGTYLLSNPAAAAALGPAERTSLVGRRIQDLLPAEALAQQQLRDAEALAASGPITYEEHAALGNQPQRHWLVTKGVIHNPDGTPRGIYAVRRDVTDLHALQNQLRQAQTLESLGRLAGGVAHEFNNVLTILMGHVGLALADVPEQSPAHRSLREVESAARRGATLTQQLLALTGRHAVERRVVDVHARMAELLGLTRSMLGEHVEVRQDLAAASAWVSLGAGQMEHILLGLALGTRASLPRSGAVLQWRTFNHAGPGPVGTRGGVSHWLCVSMQDNGTGYGAEACARMFEPTFGTVKNGPSLGLAPCYGMVAEAGGTITVESAPGHGTRFQVWLPVTTEAPSPATTPSLGLILPRNGNGRVLVAEDDDAVRLLVVRVLAHAGLDAVDTPHGEEALRRFRADPEGFRLLLTDVVMPRMGGAELAAAVRQLRPGIPLVFMSGYTEDAFVGGRALPEGAVLLQKPFSPSTLVAAVRTQLGLPAEPNVLPIS